MDLSVTLNAIARGPPWIAPPSRGSGGAPWLRRVREAQGHGIAGTLTVRHGSWRVGERVALAMENCPEYFPLLYGIWRAGKASPPVPMNMQAACPSEMA